MNTATEPQSLDELFSTAVKAYNKQEALKVAAKHKPVRKAEKDPGKVEPRKLYTDAANWRKGRGVAVIDKSTQTLLGNFQEWLHVSEPNTRQLLRIDTPICVSHTEEVDSTLFWQPEVWAQSQRNSECTLILAVELSYPEVAAVNVQLTVTSPTATFEALISARLANSYIFAGGAQLLQLPAGVNVLPVLTQQSKIALKAALTKQLEGTQ